MKACACGRQYTPAAFAQLQLKGWIGAGWHDRKPIAVELRNCVCGSTLGMECEAPKKKTALNALLAEAAKAGQTFTALHLGSPPCTPRAAPMRAARRHFPQPTPRGTRT